jgi:succinoglycan biosynthesis protein ExoM
MITIDTKIAIAICSRNRLESLSRLLSSLSRIAERKNLTVLIIENADESSYAELIDKYLRKGLNIKHFLEQNIGIPFARNRALGESSKLEIDWLAFVDDDCEVDSNWLEELIKCANEFNADVVQGHWRFINEISNTESINRHKTPWSKGQQLEMASTSSVLFNLNKLRDQVPQILFDTKLTNSGGSDSKFFYTCYMYGWKIVSCPDSIIHEHVTSERQTLSWLLRRRVRESYINFEIRFKNKDFPNSRIKMVNIIFAQIRLINQVIFQTFKSEGKTQENSGGVQILIEIATLFGFIKSLFGFKIRKYI